MLEAEPFREHVNARDLVIWGVRKPLGRSQNEAFEEGDVGLRVLARLFAAKIKRSQAIRFAAAGDGGLRTDAGVLRVERSHYLHDAR